MERYLLGAVYLFGFFELLYCKSEGPVLALKVGPFRWVKYSPIKIRPSTVQLPRVSTADLDVRAEMIPS